MSAASLDKLNLCKCSHWLRPPIHDVNNAQIPPIHTRAYYSRPLSRAMMTGHDVDTEDMPHSTLRFKDDSQSPYSCIITSTTPIFAYSSTSKCPQPEFLARSHPLCRTANPWAHPLSEAATREEYQTANNAHVRIIASLLSRCTQGTT